MDRRRDRPLRFNFLLDTLVKVRRLVRLRAVTPRPFPPRGARRALVVVSLASAMFGGVLAWALSFEGLGLAGFGIGVAATLILIGGFANRHTAHRTLAFMLGYTFAFAVLIWPILWLVVGYVRYLLTGESLGD
jgi:hypothetical protein